MIKQKRSENNRYKHVLCHDLLFMLPLDLWWPCIFDTVDVHSLSPQTWCAPLMSMHLGDSYRCAWHDTPSFTVDQDHGAAGGIFNVTVCQVSVLYNPVYRKIFMLAFRYRFEIRKTGLNQALMVATELRRVIQPFLPGMNSRKFFSICQVFGNTVS